MYINLQIAYKLTAYKSANENTPDNPLPPALPDTRVCSS